MAGTGGARPGAGRKPKPITLARQSFASSILNDDLEKAMWIEMLNATRSYFAEGMGEPMVEIDYRVRLDALKYLCDQKHGKAPQSIDINGIGKSGLEFGNLPVASEFAQPRATNKPN